MKEDNLRIVKQVYNLLIENPGAGTELFFELMDEGIRWHSVADESQPGLRFATDRNSKSEVMEYFQELSSEWELIEIRIDHFTAQEDRVIVCGTGDWRHRSTGAILTTKKADILRLQDGRIVEFTEFFDTAKARAVATNESPLSE